MSHLLSRKTLCRKRILSRELKIEIFIDEPTSKWDINEKRMSELKGQRTMMNQKKTIVKEHGS